MTEPPRDPASSADDPSRIHTSDRLYTAEELEEYARQQLPAQPAQPAQPVRDPLGDPLADPLSDPLPGYAGGWPQSVNQSASQSVGQSEGQSASPSVPQEPPVEPAPPAFAPPTGPPPTGPTTGPPTGPPPSAPPTITPAPAAPAADPTPAPTPAPVEPEPVVPEPDATTATPSIEATPELRRFMTATDFLDRRDSEKELGPASWGWRGRVRRWSGGLINPKMSAKEEAYEADRALLQKDFEGPRTIAFINPKGGAAKTTGVLAAGYTFGTVRGGGVVAWDNNETRGTLGIRGTRSTHRNTTRELLEALERFTDVYQSRIGDLGAFVRSQGDAHFDVLASDERPDVTGMIRADDFKAVHQLLERFYRIILVDTGNNMRAENWLAAADAADLLVITSTVREDTGYSGLWMLDALQDAGIQNLKYKAITVLSDPSPTVDTKLAADLVAVYEQRTRAVFRVPYDPALVAGSVVPYAQLSEATRMSWLKACAGMASSL